jgi:hypothetical protein
LFAFFPATPTAKNEARQKKRPHEMNLGLCFGGFGAGEAFSFFERKKNK